jgi:hypothetical protein
VSNGSEKDILDVSRLTKLSLSSDSRYYTVLIIEKDTPAEIFHGIHTAKVDKSAVHFIVTLCCRD